MIAFCPQPRAARINAGGTWARCRGLPLRQSTLFTVHFVG